MAEEPAQSKPRPHLDLNFLSHGTMECSDLAKTRRLFEEVFGFEVVRTSKIAMQARLNSTTTIVCVKLKDKPRPNGLGGHFGMDVATKEDVDAAHEKILEIKDQYDLQKVTRPGWIHGVYSFYVVDHDGNFWEVLKNPPGGYAHLFDKGDDERSWAEQGGSEAVGDVEKRMMTDDEMGKSGP